MYLRQNVKPFILRLLTLLFVLFNNANWSTLQNAFEIIGARSNNTKNIISQSEKHTHTICPELV